MRIWRDIAAGYKSIPATHSDRPDRNNYRIVIFDQIPYNARMWLVITSTKSNWQEICSAIESISRICVKQSGYFVLSVHYRYLDMAVKLTRELGIDDCLEIVGLDDQQHNWSTAMTLDEMTVKLASDFAKQSYRMQRQLA